MNEGTPEQKGRGHEATNARALRPRVYYKTPPLRREGVSWGYTKLCERIGEAVEHDPHERLALHCCPASKFEPVQDKTNILLTMWESRDIPVEDVPLLRQADALIVPSKFCEDVFRPHVDCAIYTVSLGVDDVFHYSRRRAPAEGERFRWFWMASPDARKGWHQVAKMWDRHFRGNPECEIYFKSTATEEDGIRRPAPGIVIDFRNLPLDELVALYHTAHGFIYSSMGEGFGFTVAEAMRTGLPVVGTRWSGQADFFDHSTGYPVGHALYRVSAIEGRESIASDGKFELAVFDRDDMAQQMALVMARYPAALKRAKTGARRIANKFTWERFQAGIARVLDRYR